MTQIVDYGQVISNTIICSHIVFSSLVIYLKHTFLRIEVLYKEIIHFLLYLESGHNVLVKQLGLHANLSISHDNLTG